MTTPIPEAAVEAASRAMYEASNGSLFDPLMLARAALTAARPLMEDEIWGKVAAEIRAELSRVSESLTSNQRQGYYRAATIAERTNDEPA